MSDDLGLLTGGKEAEPPRRRGGAGKVVAVLVVVALIGALAVGYLKADEIKDLIKGKPADYATAGTGQVIITVTEGMNGLKVAHLLEDHGVVASYQAFYDLALHDDRWNQIQPGTFTLRKHMSAETALAALVDRSNRVESKLTIPEGTRVDDIVSIIVKKTDFTKADVEAALKDTQAIGLPAAANGNPEGWLFPSTYFVEPGLSAEQLVARMVQQTKSTLTSLNADARAAQLGKSVQEIVTIASILEWEVNKDADFGKASRVIYNRLEAGEALGMDSTIHFISGRRGDIFTTAGERAVDSPYNTYLHAGLPPGPIGSPGKAALNAALNPPEGKWMFFVTNPKTGKTAFNNTLAEHTKQCRDWGWNCSL